MENRFCSKCGNNIPQGAQFCPNCGQSVVPVPVVTKPAVTKPPVVAPPRTVPPASTATPVHTQPRNSKSWIWVPVAMIGLIVILWAVLAGMPFGGNDGPVRQAQPQVDVIAERPAAENTAPITEVTQPGEQPVVPPLTTSVNTTPSPAQTSTVTATPPPMTSAAPPVTARPTPVPVTPAPAPVRQTPPVQQPKPAPQPSTSAPAPARDGSGEISESEAMSLLRNYIGTRDQYGSSVDCVTVGSEGYKNRGYTLYARDKCDNHSFGRWRVDALTREVFREKSDGRFLRP